MFQATKTMRGEAPSPMKTSNDASASAPLIASLPQTTAIRYPTSIAQHHPENTPERPEPPSPATSSLFWTSSSSILAPVLNLFGASNGSCGSTANSPATSEEDTEEEILMDEQVVHAKQEEEEEAKLVTTTTPNKTVLASSATTTSMTTNEFDPILFIALLPCHSTALRTNLHVFRPVLPLLSPHKPTLVLDLDETLVHCNAASEGQAGTFDISFEVKFNNVGCNVYVRKRPHLDAFLQHVASKFEVIVFTASQRVYAETLLDLLDPNGQLIHHRLFRESCVMVSGNLVKDLSVLNRDLARTMIVDNCPHAFAYQVDNGIPIQSWYEDASDVELVKLMGLLDELHQVDDVRPIISKAFGISAMVEEVKAQLIY